MPGCQELSEEEGERFSPGPVKLTVGLKLTVSVEHDKKGPDPSRREAAEWRDGAVSSLLSFTISHHIPDNAELARDLHLQN